MDHGHFDALTRSVGAGATRRVLVRLLAAGALGGLVARLGLAETAVGKPKKHKAKTKKRPSQGERKAHGQLQAAGKSKGKGKGKGKGKKKPRRHPRTPPPPLPPGCEFCTDCQMCQDGACVRDPALDGVRCLGSGATCGYCQSGQCAASTAPPCEDGVCPVRSQCCSGEKKCVDPESPTGFSCLGADDCCPDQRKCAGGCVYRQACCPEARPQCGPCDEALCVNGAWVCSTKCCANQKPCPGGTCVAKTACCPGQKPCPDGECIPENQCCPNEVPPVCPYCEVAVCEGGAWTCEFDASTCPPCPAGTVTCPGLRHSFSSLPCCWEPWYVPDYMGHPACFPGGVYLCDY